MKNVNIKIILLAFISMTLVSDAQEIKKLPELNALHLSDLFTVVLSQSDVNSIKINADSILRSKIKFKVSEGILNLTADTLIQPSVSIEISVKSLNHLIISGSSQVITSNRLNCNNLIIESNDAGNVFLDLKANEIKTILNSSGDITLRGTAQRLDASLLGTGELRASDLLTDTVKVKVSGIGNARVSVKQKLEADIAGTGSVIYKGKPTDRNIIINGTGSVRESKSGNGEETGNNTDTLNLIRKKFLIIPDKDYLKEQNKKFLANLPNRQFKNWLGIELGVNGLLDYKNSLDLPASAHYLSLNYPRSLQFGLNLLEKDFHFYKNYLNIVTGLGFDFNHYALQKNTTLISSPTSISAYTDSLFYYKKNTLNISYIKAPLLVEINTNKDYKHSTHIALGVEFACRIHAVTKQTKELYDKHYKIRQRDDFNLQPFRYSAVARLGYRNFTLFANYGINGLFKKKQGPQVYPFIIGIAVNFKN